MAKNQWNADPEKYAQMAEPFESVEQAKEVAAEFLKAVGRLREQYRIAEMTIQVQVYAQGEDGHKIVSGGAGYGDQMEQAKMAHRAFNQELGYLFKMLRTVADAMPEIGQEMISQ